MSTSNNSLTIPMFNGENYHIWTVKMKFVLRFQGFKKDKVITCLHAIHANHIFTKIMDLETPKQVWNKIQDEFEGNNKVKFIRLITLKREFELKKMEDNEYVKGCCEPNMTS
uniref:DUF4219 domain-containing protein n=1 Tax=Cajanus cajan TaxID=3821 RepID=A0A151TPQ8_CAJCA|nr:hypothetical protein KK1_022692 [Cajanus cajan]